MANSMPPDHGRMIVIGAGNPERGDDAAGRAVVRLLRGTLPDEVALVELDGEATALLAHFEDVETAFIVDACASGLRAGSLQRFDVSAEPLPQATFSLSTHGFGLAEGIELARALGQLPERCIVYAIEGTAFEAGAPLSPQVAAAVTITAARLLYEAFGDSAFDMTHLPPITAFSPAERTVLRTMLARGVNSPLASSIGRLFDAFAALCGLRQRASYEGQAASELEWAAGDLASGRSYEFALRDPPQKEGAIIVDWQPALEMALADLRAGALPGTVSEALHNGLARAIVAVAARIGEHRVLLTGGCFQNARLTEAAVRALRSTGHEPVWHQRVPPNDGGIALGQAAWAVWSEQKGQKPCA